MYRHKHRETHEPVIGRAHIPHRYAWLWEPLEEEPSFVVRSMFGSKAVYLHARLMVCLCAKADPWSGMLVCTEREHHSSLMSDFPELTPHSVLPKWLYLPDSNANFDRVAEKIIQLALKRDPRMGIVPQPKKRSRQAKAKKPKGPSS